MAIEVLGNNITDLAEAGSWRNADVFAQVVEALEYSKTNARIKRLQFSCSLQCLMAAGGHGPRVIIDLILCECGRRKRSRDQEEKAAVSSKMSNAFQRAPLLLRETGSTAELFQLGRTIGLASNVSTQLHGSKWKAGAGCVLVPADVRSRT
jgi:hypothetical protein